MKFKSQFTPSNFPQSSCSKRQQITSRNRLRDEKYCERLKALYATICTQAEIVEILNDEFEGCRLKLPQLKKEIKRLGLKRYKARRRSSGGSEGNAHVGVLKDHSDHINELGICDTPLRPTSSAGASDDLFSSTELERNEGMSSEYQEISTTTIIPLNDEPFDDEAIIDEEIDLDGMETSAHDRGRVDEEESNDGDDPMGEATVPVDKSVAVIDSQGDEAFRALNCLFPDLQLSWQTESSAPWSFR